MKQKIVISLSNMNDCRCRCKVLKIAVGISGVEKLALTGKEKDQLEVEGDGIDSVVLTRRLRKKFGHAVIVSVGEAKKEESVPTHPPAVAVLPPPCYYGLPTYYCEVVEPAYGPSCTIT